jgi:ketosteroid isomerase-like protein
MARTDQSVIPENFLNSQVELLEAGNTAAVAKRYTEDAVFVRFGSTCRGRAEIKQLFDDYLTENPDIQGLDGVEVTDNVILYQAKERLNGKLVTAVGTLVFTGSLVSRQTAVFVDPFVAT